MEINNNPEENLIREKGAELITSLFGLFKTLAIFDINNKNSKQAFAKFQSLLGKFLAINDKIDVQLVGNQFFLNENKVIAELSGYDTLDRFAGEMILRGTGSFSILSNTTEKDILTFADYFMGFEVSPEFKDSPFDEFREGFDELGLNTIEIGKVISDDAVASASDEEMEEEVHVFLTLIYVLVKIFKAVGEGKKINLKNAKRAVQKMYTIIEDNPKRIVTLLRVADLEVYLPFHSANVAVYSVLIANRLGLGKKKVADVGVCGLFHDLGMLKVPPEVLKAQGELSREQWEYIWKHPIEGSKVLLRTDRMIEVVIRSIQVAFEHQMRKDDMGYPQTASERELNLYSKIIKVADAFSSMTTDRPYRKAMGEGEALKNLMDDTDTAYERILVKILANVLGVYPEGSSVKLNTGELGKIMKENPDPNYRDKPVLKIYADAHGKKVDKVVDMMEKENGVFKYWIVPFDEDELDLDVSEFISIM